MEKIKKKITDEKTEEKIPKDKLLRITGDTIYNIRKKSQKSYFYQIYECDENKINEIFGKIKENYY